MQPYITALRRSAGKFKILSSPCRNFAPIEREIRNVNDLIEIRPKRGEMLPFCPFDCSCRRCELELAKCMRWNASLLSMEPVLLLNRVIMLCAWRTMSCDNYWKMESFLRDVCLAKLFFRFDSRWLVRWLVYIIDIQMEFYGFSLLEISMLIYKKLNIETILHKTETVYQNLMPINTNSHTH